MPNTATRRVALLDDYQGVALSMADWSRLNDCDVVAFNRNLGSDDERAEALREFDVVMALRERMPLSRALIERLPRLKLIVTAGNAPGVNDGAGAVIVASSEWAEREGKTPLATVLSYGTVADDFPYLAKTPANAAKAALAKVGMSPDDVDLWEINEAFASVTLNSIRMLGIDETKVNVNGGAVALGHPIGASGARILGTLVHELRRRGGGIGCAAICSGGGQGDAVLVQVDSA